MRLRPATLDDLDLLRRWDEQPHVIACDPSEDDDWAWEVELARHPDWREQLIGEIDGRPIGCVQIIDPAREESHYWGDVPADLRAIDIWIGAETDLSRGYGTAMMRLALARCFADPAVSAVLIDPLAANVRAHRFYERLGFKFVERRRFNDDDCFVYRLDRADFTWTPEPPLPALLRHLNCGTLHAPPNPKASCHCLLLEGAGGKLTLIDTGIGLHDVADPSGRIGQQLIDIAGFQFHEAETAVRQIDRLGYRATDVTDIVLTHGDPDHTGGLADFPAATVHISEVERDRLASGHWRYLPQHFAHGPKWRTFSAFDTNWFGLSACPVTTAGGDVLVVWLPGHTLGHCGVAVRQGDRWLLHVGDAYYLRVELDTDDHPVSQLAAARADDDALRRASLEHLRRLHRDHAAEVSLFGYHDFTEFPAGLRTA
jgi:glyoxylase-like metal-dependent hydrolase (beta-lactamase superfamily II)/RimJ/RimL family protein N-acetyltransferase